MKGPFWTSAAPTASVDGVVDDVLDAGGPGVPDRGVCVGVGVLLRPGSSAARIGLPLRNETVRNSICCVIL
jgi:hypothetical protein